MLHNKISSNVFVFTVSIPRFSFRVNDNRKLVTINVPILSADCDFPFVNFCFCATYNNTLSALAASISPDRSLGSHEFACR